MSPRVLTLILACLAFHSVLFPTSSAATEAARTARLDGKTLYIPTVELTQKVNPVNTFLYIGSWETSFGAGKTQRPLCTIDSENYVIRIDSPQTLLKNSTPQVLTQDTVDAFLGGISWGQKKKTQATHVAFNIISQERRPAMIEINTSSDAVLYQNGKFAGIARAADARAAEGHGYIPITLSKGENIINIKQYSSHGKPRIQMAVNLDFLQGLQAAWQPRRGLLEKLVYPAAGQADPIKLDWSPKLVGFYVSLDIRDVSTDQIVLQKEHVLRGRVIDNDSDALAPGIYEALYQAKDETASEFFIIGNPPDLLADLRNTLSKYTPDDESKLDIAAQLRRADILLAEKNHDALDRKWQEKLVYTLSSLATFARLLKDGATNIAKDQPGLHIRGFASAEDGSDQFYRLYIPTTYKPDTPLPLLVIPAARMRNRERPFIEGPIIANHREAQRWSKAAEQYGFALLWPGLRGVPDGYSYESVHINEAIRAVENDYAIDPHRISVYGTCSAGYNAGRLVEQYPNRFAAIIYDRAIIDLSLDNIQPSPSLMEWYTTVNPSRRIIENQNIKIFVMHDGTRPPGHGPVENSIAFLDLARQTRGDVVSNISTRPMTLTERMDTVFSWLASCRNENPDDKRSLFLAKAGYLGPIMEIFATPILVVEGTHAQDDELKNIQSVVKSFQKDYTKYFHGAKCMVKKDADVTEDDIVTYSLILVGNPQSNSVWQELQPSLPIKMTTTAALYGNDRLTGLKPFQAIARHPTADDKYVLMLGAVDLRTLGQITTSDLFTAWYDCYLYNPDKIISKLDSLHDTQKAR